jgi:hypothetical protein
MEVAIKHLPSARGEICEGGFFAGCLRVNLDIYGLVVSPIDGEHAATVWNKSKKALGDAMSYNNGLANTKAMATAGSKLAAWALELRIAGFDDWYLPSRDELELLYRHFKPSATENYAWRHGDNPSSMPPGYPYTDDAPAQTTIANFAAGGADAFAPEWYWSSTQSASNPDSAWCQYFTNGDQYGTHEDYELRARAVRRVKI